MSYQLNKELAFNKNISNIATEEIYAGIEALKNIDIHEAIHDIRRHLKKLRALAKLFRSAMEVEKFNFINAYFKELGQDLSEIRDLTANLESIQFLKDSNPTGLEITLFNDIEVILRSKRDLLTSRLISENYFSEYIFRKLEYAHAHLTTWELLSIEERPTIITSLGTVYLKAKYAMDAAYFNPTNISFHEWRKKVKDLWYQTILIQDIYPNYYLEFEPEIRVLADYLGTDHDLMILKEQLSLTDLELHHGDIHILSNFLDVHSEILRSKASAIGVSLFKENVEFFINRFHESGERSDL